MSPATSYKISSDLVISSWNVLTNPDNLVQSCQSNAVVDSKKTKGKTIANFRVGSASGSEAVLSSAENSKASSNVGGQSAALAATCSSDQLDAEHSKYDTGDKITRQTRLSKSKKLETINSVAIPYEDKMCNTDFNVKGDFARHTKTHGTKHPFQCDECGYECVRVSHLKRHTRTHTGECPFKCKECGKAFTQKCNLIKHERIHTGECPYKCKECGNRFSRADHLKKHTKTHTSKRPFQCDVCGSGFGRLDHLKRHKKIHTDERPFQCDVCEKTFAQKHHLKEHKKIHTGEHPFKCDICNKRFNQKSNLTVHKRTHTGECPFTCDICDKRFTQKGNLTVHKRTHTDELPFKGAECGKGFQRKTHLNNHVFSHSSAPPFKGDACDASFWQTTNSETEFTTPDDVSTITQLPSVSNQPSTNDTHITKSQNQEEYREYTETVALLNEFSDMYPVTPMDPGSCEQHDDLFLDQEMSEATFPDKQNADTGYLITQFHPVADWPLTSGIHVNKSQHQEKYEKIAEVLDYNHLQTIPPLKPSWDSGCSLGNYDDDELSLSMTCEH